MKKKLILLLSSALLLTGCAGYKNPALTQLKGKHISEIQSRISRFDSVDTSGMFSNHYYLYDKCIHVGDNITYNRWGEILSRTPIEKCGYIRFETDKDGIIENYTEHGYTTDADFESYFKDLVVIEK